MAVTNSYIIYKKVARSPVSHFQFRCEFVRYLLDSEVQRNPRGRKRSLVDNNKRLTEKYFPELIPTQPDAKVRNPTRKRVVCNTNVGKRVTPGVDSKRKETRYWCANCEKPLCVDCFKRYHTLVQYKLPQNNESDCD
jgi:hypothetical protein